MSTAPEELRDRTKAFAVRIVKLYRSLPHTADSQVVGKQLLRCGTSVAANYRAEQRQIAGRMDRQDRAGRRGGADETVFGWKCCRIVTSFPAGAARTY